MEEQNSPNIEEFQTFLMHTRSRWTSPIMSYLKDGRLPLNLEEAKKIQKRATRFTVINDKLYKRGFSQPYLRCVEEEEAKYVLEEVHRGVCGDHMEAKSFIQNIMRVDYFRPTMQQDEFRQKMWQLPKVWKCPTSPWEKMTTISLPWPFAQWGIDIMGPLPQGKR